MNDKEDMEDKIVKALFSDRHDNHTLSDDYTIRVMSAVHHFEFVKSRKKYLREQLTLGFGGLVMFIVALVMLWKTGWVTEGIQLIQPYAQPVLDVVPDNIIKIVLIIIAIQAILMRGLLGFFLFKKDKLSKSKFLIQKVIK